jgi:electron transfer flavoprotein alpha subunit
MSVLVYIESPKGIIKKQGLEAATYAAQLAASMSTECVALLIGEVQDLSLPGKYGATKVLHYNGANAKDFDAQIYTDIIASAAEKSDAAVVIMAHSSTGKSLLGRVAVRMGAGAVSGVTGLPDTSSGFIVTKSVFSGKAIAHYNITTDKKVLSLMGNSIQPVETGGEAKIEVLDVPVRSPKVKVLERKTTEGVVPLPEAELVVSAGRGLKGPENWGIVEELADALGATTACSRPVADSGWRPHHEHVGQTGVAIRPNLYIALGISGAIQHLAGVNNSRTIVVINKDPEAPFFKAADYGVVGDVFEVVPKLTAAVKKLKHS